MNIYFDGRFGGEPVELEEGSAALSEAFVIRRRDSGLPASECPQLLCEGDLKQGMDVHAQFPFGSNQAHCTWAILTLERVDGIGWVGKPTKHAGEPVPGAWCALLQYTANLGWEVGGWVAPSVVKRLTSPETP